VIATVVVAVTEVVDADTTSAVWTATATDRTDAITCGIQAVLVRQTLRQEALLPQSINQTINVKFVGRRYTTRPGAPTVVSGKHDHKVHS